MKEPIDILRPDGALSTEAYNRADRDEIHMTGDWHGSVHVWLVDTANGDILLQQRAKTKESFPGMLDAPVAGHIAAGETPQEAALREASEEIGIDIDPDELALVGVHRLIIEHPERRFVSREFNYVFACEADIRNLSLKRDPSEIDGFDCLDIGYFLRNVHGPMMTPCCVAPAEIALLKAYLEEDKDKGER